MMKMMTYGAKYSTVVEDEIARINGDIDHCKHWSLADRQACNNLWGATRTLQLGSPDWVWTIWFQI